MDSGSKLMGGNLTSEGDSPKMKSPDFKTKKPIVITENTDKRMSPIRSLKEI